METYKFVYPEIDAHKPYRAITRDTPLKNHYGSISYRPRDVGLYICFPFLQGKNLNDVEYMPKDLDRRQKYIDEQFIRECGGVNLCNQAIRARGFRECGLRLSRHVYDYDGPTALEALSWGIGVFRESRTEQDTTFMIVTGREPLPKVTSKHAKVLQHHLVPVEERETDDAGRCTGKNVKGTLRYESTNIILADSYGELEQLGSRLNEKGFMRMYLGNLKKTAQFVRPPPHQKSEAPECMGYFLQEYAEAWLKHIGNGIWKSPPQSVDELSYRVKFLLENTLIDEKATEEVTDYKYHAPMFDEPVFE